MFETSVCFAEELLDFLYTELLLDEFLFVSTLKLDLLQLKILVKGNAGICAESGCCLFSNYSVVYVNADIVERLLTSQQGFVDHPTWPTFAPSHRVLPNADLASTLCQNTTIRVVYLIAALVKLGWNNGVDFKASAVYE